MIVDLSILDFSSVSNWTQLGFERDLEDNRGGAMISVDVESGAKFFSPLLRLVGGGGGGGGTFDGGGGF